MKQMLRIGAIALALAAAAQVLLTAFSDGKALAETKEPDRGIRTATEPGI